MRNTNLKTNVYSQNGEDGIINHLLKAINSEKDYWCCEFGAWDGKHYSNTFNLVENDGYNAVHIEGDEPKFQELLKTCEKFKKIIPLKEYINEKNLLDDILSKTDIPKNFDVLSIDVDGIDYSIWNNFKNYSPKIVIIEINSGLEPKKLYNDDELTEKVLYSRPGVNFSTCYELAKRKNYSLFFHTGNMIFVHNNYKHLVECYNDENYMEAFDKTWGGFK
jgi:hypothetical protein